VNGFAVDPGNAKNLYAAMRDGIFKSADAGETWQPLGKEVKNAAAVTVHPKKSNEIYAATAGGLILRSTDGGMTWNAQK
jgi:photosystem II stability/assembly factor-like uncharacterized protein